MKLDSHHKPENISDRIAFGFTKFLRFVADTFFKKKIWASCRGAGWSLVPRDLWLEAAAHAPEHLRLLRAPQAQFSIAKTNEAINNNSFHLMPRRR